MRHIGYQTFHLFFLLFGIPGMVSENFLYLPDLTDQGRIEDRM